MKYSPFSRCSRSIALSGLLARGRLFSGFTYMLVDGFNKIEADNFV
ncbi:MAG: hypothetical protein ABIA21_02370 [Candidatus Aenigmatarchaeota archaeon]